MVTRKRFDPRSGSNLVAPTNYIRVEILGLGVNRPATEAHADVVNLNFDNVGGGGATCGYPTDQKELRPQSPSVEKGRRYKTRPHRPGYAAPGP